MIDFSIMKTKRNEVSSAIQPNMTRYVVDSVFTHVHIISHVVRGKTATPRYADVREELIIQCKNVQTQ